MHAATGCRGAARSPGPAQTLSQAPNSQEVSLLSGTRRYRRRPQTRANPETFARKVWEPSTNMCEYPGFRPVYLHM